MGCGGFGNIFRLFDYYEYPGRTCSSGENYPYYEERQNDTEEKLMLIKKMYVEGAINEEEYEVYKQRVFERSIGFEELIEIRRNRLNKRTNSDKAQDAAEDKYRNKIEALRQYKEKIVRVEEKLLSRISELQGEKEALEKMAGAFIKSNEQKAEEYIRKKIEIEEPLQRLNKYHKDLKTEIEEIEGTIRMLNTKLLEVEALQLKEEVSNIKMQLDENG
jgi:hypothetical protein